MYWLAIPIALALGKLISSSFSTEEKEAKKNWEQNKRKVEKKLEEHKRFIKQNIDQCNKSYDYQFLKDMHYSSFIVADSAYKLLKDVQLILIGINKMILDLKRKKDKKRASEFRKELFKERDNISMESNRMRNKLNELNIQTGNLKYIIRDKCGVEGKEWFERLEARKQKRK
jgi:hypothetical protein